MQFFHHTLRNLVRDERGNVLITFGLTSLVAVAAVGGAVDFGRAHQQKSKMQNALDAAVVSAVSKMKETNNWSAAQAHAMAVFQGVYTNAAQGTSAGALDVPVVSFAQAGTQISGSAVMKTSTPFLKLVTGNDLQVGAASSAVPPNGKMLEVALMVDVTGSMGWSAPSGAAATACGIVSGTPVAKIDFLKCAAEDLLNILLPANGSNDSSVKVGIAPFSDKVNAGEFAEKVVDPVLYPATGGSYTPRDNLAQTRQGPFTGTYATAGSQPSGSQFGAMGTSPTAGATNTAAGATYVNGYCANPTTPAVASVMGTFPSGVVLSQRNHNNSEYPYWGIPVSVTGTKPGSVLEANNLVRGGSGAPSSSVMNRREGDRLTLLNWHSTERYWIREDADGRLDSAGTYYVPFVTTPNGMVAKTYNGFPVGVKVPTDEHAYDGFAITSPGMGIQRNVNGYYKVTSWNGTDWNYTWVGAATSSSNRDLYVRLYDGLETGYQPATPAGVVSGCETTTTTSSSKLITCVTERKSGTDVNFTAEAIGTGKYVGPYNHGGTSKSNYSSDGKCYSAGRELPPVIPLTNSRSTLTSFFQDITVGGATAGHLGTAWASYLLSPDWSNIWPGSSTPTAYTNTGVKKAAILMTDGQYNIQFSFGSSASNISAKQALMICKEMRSKGIQVYTIGFGFAANATPPTTNIEGMSDSDRTTPLTGGTWTETQKALDTLAKCASSNSSYYFPYDGEALRTVFKNIASSLSSDLNGGNARLTN